MKGLTASIIPQNWPAFPNLQRFTSVEALQTSTFRIFMKVPLHKCDRFDSITGHWHSIQPPSPLQSPDIGGWDWKSQSSNQWLLLLATIPHPFQRYLIDTIKDTLITLMALEIPRIFGALLRSEVKVKVLVMSDSLQPHGLYSPWNSLGQNTGVGSLSLLQRIFPTQESNPGLLHCRWILYQLSHKGSP